MSRLGVKKEATLCDVIEASRLPDLPEHVGICLSNFYAGLRPLVLLWRLPSPRELLSMQASGRRCVSALVSERALRTIWGHRDCLEMLVHDLSHMEKFIEAGRYWQQVGFFEFLRASAANVHRDRWSRTLGNRWRLSWNYVSADMNAIANHLLLTLKAQLMVAVARATLREAGLTTVLDEEQDAALSEEQADAYPRASISETTLTHRFQARSDSHSVCPAGLVGTFEAAFEAEWRGLIEEHLQDASRRFPGLAPSSDGAVGGDRGSAGAAAAALGPDFASWPRPSARELLEAATAGREKTAAHRAEYAAALIAHFDELGRRHLCGGGGGAAAL